MSRRWAGLVYRSATGDLPFLVQNVRDSSPFDDFPHIISPIVTLPGLVILNIIISPILTLLGLVIMNY